MERSGKSEVGQSGWQRDQWSATTAWKARDGAAAVVPVVPDVPVVPGEVVNVVERQGRGEKQMLMVRRGGDVGGDGCASHKFQLTGLLCRQRQTSSRRKMRL